MYSDRNARIDGTRFTFPLPDTVRVQFGFDRHKVSREYVEALDNAAKAILENPDQDVVSIEGHTCVLGSDSYNDHLSQERAESVRGYLLLKGVPPLKLTTKWYGKRHPLCNEPTATCFDRNRRVEFVVVGLAQ